MNHLIPWLAACAVLGCARELPVPDNHRIRVCWSDGSPVDSAWVRVLGRRPSDGTFGSGSPYTVLSDTLRAGAAGVTWERSGMPVALDVAAFHREAGWMPAVRVVLEAPEAAVWTVGAATPTWYRFQLSRTPGLWNPPAQYFVFPQWTAPQDPNAAWAEGLATHADAWYDPQEPSRPTVTWPDVLPPSDGPEERLWSVHARMPDGMVRYCGVLTTPAGPALDTLVVPVTP